MLLKMLEGINARRWGEKTRAEDMEEWALGYFGSIFWLRSQEK